MNSWARVLRSKLEELFGIDLRSLALFRVCLGLIILVDLLTRLPDLNAFYTDAGLLPRAALVSGQPQLISAHLMNGTVFFQAALFLLQGVCAVGLLVGYRTRLMTWLSWFLMFSLHWRFHSILGGGDEYLRFLLFWCLFLPLGARWSVDRALDGSAAKTPMLLCTWGTAAILVQNALVYVMAAAYKLRDPVWMGGNGLYYALNIFNYARANVADALLQFPDFLRFVTRAVIGFEFLGPCLLLFPVWTKRIRTVAVLLFFGLHLAFFACFYLKNFPWVSMAALLLFLPSWFWENITWRLPRPSEGVAGAFRRLTAHLVRRPVAVRPSAFSELSAIFFLSCVVYWNVGNFFKVAIPLPLRQGCAVTALAQTWSLFTPPSKRSGWLVVPGRLKNGTLVDLYRDGAPLSWEQPSLALVNKNARWQRLIMVDFVFKRNKRFWPYYANYFCRSWNASHNGPKRLESLELVMMERTMALDGPGAYQKRVLLRRQCAGGGPGVQGRWRHRRVPRASKRP